MKNTLKRSSWFIIALLFFSAPSKIRAQEVLFQDDFSNGFAKWESIRSNADYWSIVDGQAEAYVPTRGTVIEMVPKDEYWNPAWKDIEYQFDFTPLAGVDRNTSFGVFNTLNWYEIHFVENSFQVVRVEKGTVPFEINESYRLENGRTYKVVIRLEKSNIKIFINNYQIFNRDDWTNEEGIAGKIGIKAGTGAVAPTRLRYDNVIVRSLNAPTPPAQDGKQLEYTTFKQTNPLWKDSLYDTATAWSALPTMNRWGCATTSLAMIMHYHGLTTMPDGSPVTPGTLNEWLKTQADGYVQEGLVNWVAGTRLTRLISEKFGTVKLEYRWSGDTTIATVANEIMANKPSIVKIAGHFLTVNGVTGDGKDLYIKDPSYDYTKFSQHNKELLSARLFQPSHTDLSYLLLTHEPQLNVQVTNQQGQPVANWESFTDFLKDSTGESNESSAPTQIQQLAKPAAGIYKVSVAQPQFGPFSFQFFAYDAAANPTALHQAGLVDSRPLTFTVKYQREGSSTMAQTVNFTQFRADLKLMKDQGQFKQLAAYSVLDKHAASGEKSTTPEKRRHYAELLSVQVKAHQSQMKAEGYQYLTQQVQALNSTF